MSRLLNTVTELHQAMSALRAGEARLSAIPESMRELHEEHAERSRGIEQLEGELARAQGDRLTAEGEIGDGQEKLKHYQQQVSLVRNQREYGALLAEIDNVKAQSRALEEQALQAMDSVESAEKALTEERAAFVDLQTRYKEELARWEAEKPAIAASLVDVRKRVDSLSAQVPKPILVRLQRLLERYRGEAMSPVRLLDRLTKGPQVWACGVCNYRVRPQVVVEIRNEGSLIECDSCKRILYFEA